MELKNSNQIVEAINFTSKATSGSAWSSIWNPWFSHSLFLGSTSLVLALILEVYPLMCPKCLIAHNGAMFKSYKKERNHSSTSLANSSGFFWLYRLGFVCPWTNHWGKGQVHIPSDETNQDLFLELAEAKATKLCEGIWWEDMLSHGKQSTVIRRQREINAGQ